MNKIQATHGACRMRDQCCAVGRMYWRTGRAAWVQRVVEDRWSCRDGVAWRCDDIDGVEGWLGIGSGGNRVRVRQSQALDRVAQSQVESSGVESGQVGPVWPSQVSFALSLCWTCSSQVDRAGLGRDKENGLCSMHVRLDRM